MSRAINEKHLLTQIQRGDKSSFSLLYNTYAKELLDYAYSYVKDKQVSEDLVQEVFLSLWTRRKKIDIALTIKQYLYGAIKFNVLSYFRSEGVKQRYIEHFCTFVAQSSNQQIKEIMDTADLMTIISSSLKSLPPKCQHAFYLSRFEHKTIKEIAEEMNISTRTVENYISQAIKHLRVILKNYSWLIILLCEGK